MNEEKTIYHFLSVKGIDYVNCQIPTLLESIEGYFHFIDDETLFSDQMLMLSRSIEENRNGYDAIRVSMKSLELLSTQPFQGAGKPEPRPDS